ncbi:hypothetical protein BJY59DRAFT_165377 [Rhodotorula toruloides]
MPVRYFSVTSPQREKDGSKRSAKGGGGRSAGWGLPRFAFEHAQDSSVSARSTRSASPQEAMRGAGQLAWLASRDDFWGAFASRRRRRPCNPTQRKARQGRSGMEEASASATTYEIDAGTSIRSQFARSGTSLALSFVAGCRFCARHCPLSLAMKISAFYPCRRQLEESGAATDYPSRAGDPAKVVERRKEQQSGASHRASRLWEPTIRRERERRIASRVDATSPYPLAVASQVASRCRAKGRTGAEEHDPLAGEEVTKESSLRGARSAGGTRTQELV